MEKEISEEARVGSVEVGEIADPWLVFPEGISKNEDEHIFCNILEEDGNDKNKYFVKSISDQMHGTSCLASYSNGSSSWLVMMKDSDDDDDDDDGDSSSSSSPSSCFLWNPVSSETIQLPPLQIEEDGSADELLFCILSSPPTDPDCMVLVFLQSPTIIYCRPCVDEQWSKQDYEIGDGDRIVCAAFVSNSIYAYTHQAKILAIDRSSTISSVSLSLRLLDVKPPEHPPEIQHTRIYLLESCGELFLVCIIFVGLTDTPVINTIEVFKMDFSVMSWVKVEMLGDCCAFFLSLYGSMSCAGGGRIKGNCIYFTLSEDSKSLYVFHMEDGNVSVSMPCPDLMPPFSDPYWIMMPATSVNENKGGYEERMNGTSNSVAPPPMQWTADMTKFTTTTTSRTTTTRSPWLMFFAQDEEDTCFFLDPGSNKTYFMNLPECSGAKIRFSKDNWLLMTRGRHSVFFFNPFTKAKIDLPDMPLNYYFDGITFSSLPTSSDCMVFGIAQTLPEVVEICSYHVGQDESWNYLATECDEEKPFIISHSNPVFYNGAFHCLSREGRFGVFGVKDDGWNWTVLPNPQQCSCPSSHYSFLVECDGELLSVFVGHVGESVQVYKLDRSIMSWETVESLGDYMVFLSRTTSLARMTREEKMQNKIYFPRVWVNNNLAVFYSMKTRRYHSFSNHSTGDLCGTKEQVHCSWV